MNEICRKTVIANIIAMLIGRRLFQLVGCAVRILAAGKGKIPPDGGAEILAVANRSTAIGIVIRIDIR